MKGFTCENSIRREETSKALSRHAEQREEER
jgi:hypothetical protein